MPEVHELLDVNPSAALMLAEHERVSNLYLHNAAMAEKRINIHLLVVAGGGTLLLSLPQIMGQSRVGGGFFPIVDSLMLPGSVIVLLVAIEGIFTFQRIIARRIRAIEYLRAINRLNRYFADRDSALWKYLPWPCYDDKPGYRTTALGVADLRDVVAVLNSFYAGVLGADLALLCTGATRAGESSDYSHLEVLLAVVLGLLIAAGTWLWHARYERTVVEKAEKESSERIVFPSFGATVERGQILENA